MVPGDKVGGGDGAEPPGQGVHIPRRHLLGLIQQIPGEDDDVGLRLRHRLEQIPVSLPEGGGVQIGEVDNGKAVKSLRQTGEGTGKAFDL